MLPTDELPLGAPPELKLYPVAAAKWVELMKLYTQMEADIVSALDRDLLIDYCMMTEYVKHLDRLYAVAAMVLNTLEQKAKRTKKDPETLASNIGYVSEKMIDINARMERQRMALQKLREALYLSPKARAGYNPQRKPAPPAPDEMDEILGSLDV